MMLTNATRIRIGRDATRERMARLLESWPVLLEGREAPPETVDLRYTNGIAVHWRDPADPEQT
jgi:cell division protein FtsQ